MSKYELVVISDARLTAEEKDALNKQITQSVDKFAGKVINSEVWLEKNKMSFPIKKIFDGCYTIYNLELTPESVPNIRRELTLNDQVLRHLFVKQDVKKASKPREKKVAAAV